MTKISLLLSDDLAARYDAWAAGVGGRSAALRRHIQSAVGGFPIEPHAGASGTALPATLTFRLSAEDDLGLASAAAERGLTRSAWCRSVIRCRLQSQPTFERGDEVSLISIQTELRRISVNINQIARALNTAVVECKVPELELSALEDFRAEVRGHMQGVREAFKGNLAYWESGG